MAKDWDWHSAENKEDIVFPSVEALAIYLNEAGSIVIRQQDFLGEDDEVIVIPISHAESVIKALQDAIINS